MVLPSFTCCRLACTQVASYACLLAVLSLGIQPAPAELFHALLKVGRRSSNMAVDAYQNVTKKQRRGEKKRNKEGCSLLLQPTAGQQLGSLARCNGGAVQVHAVNGQWGLQASGA